MGVDAVVPGNAGQIPTIGIDDVKVVVARAIRSEDDLGSIGGPVWVGVEGTVRWEFVMRRGGSAQQHAREEEREEEGVPHK